MRILAPCDLSGLNGDIFNGCLGVNGFLPSRHWFTFYWKTKNEMEKKTHKVHHLRHIQILKDFRQLKQIKTTNFTRLYYIEYTTHNRCQFIEHLNAVYRLTDMDTIQVKWGGKGESNNNINNNVKDKYKLYRNVNPSMNINKHTIIR